MRLISHLQTKTQLALMHHKVWRLVKKREPKPEDNVLSPHVIAWNDKNDHALTNMDQELLNNYIHLLNLGLIADVVRNNFQKLKQQYSLPQATIL